MACLDVNIFPYLTEKKSILFSCVKFFSKRHFGVYLIHEDYLFELWNFIDNESFYELKSKQNPILMLEKINSLKDIQILDFVISESLNKFLMLIRNNEGKIYLIFLDHDKNEQEFQIDQMYFL